MNDGEMIVYKKCITCNKELHLDNMGIPVKNTGWLLGDGVPVCLECARLVKIETQEEASHYISQVFESLYGFNKAKQRFYDAKHDLEQLHKESQEDFKKLYDMAYSERETELSFDNVIGTLGLSHGQQQDLRLVFKMAADNNLIIIDWDDIKAIIQYALSHKEITNSYCFNVKNLNSILRLIALAEIDNKTVLPSKKHLNLRSSSSFPSGVAFEQFCAELLVKNGYNNVTLTPGSGDRGIDILADKDFVSYAIQCKYYSSPVGNSAIQEAYSGKQIYHRDIAIVMTNSSFTKQATEDAHSLGVKLWDGYILNRLNSKG